MSWHYQIVKHKDDTVGLHEVYTNEELVPHSATAESLIGDFEDVEDLLGTLRMMLRDAENGPVLCPPESWGI